MFQDGPKVHSSLCHQPHCLCQEVDTLPSFPVLTCIPHYDCYTHTCTCTIMCTETTHT